jgi:hypothetical protein
MEQQSIPLDELDNLLQQHPCDLKQKLVLSDQGRPTGNRGSPGTCPGGFAPSEAVLIPSHSRGLRPVGSWGLREGREGMAGFLQKQSLSACLEH